MTKRIDPSLIPDAPDLCFEMALWQQGFQYVAGLDEAGRGALAGPVAVGVVILPASREVTRKLAGVRDSKQLTPNRRELLAGKIRQESLSWAVGFAEPDEIDDTGIVPAIRTAASRALAGLHPFPDYLLLDYLFLPDMALPQSSLIKGDQRSLTIAAASILAKTVRDRLMRKYDNQFPQYHFGNHKGYGTSFHRFSIRQFGMCPIHRKTFRLKG